MNSIGEWETVGNNDLRIWCDGAGGFYHVTLRDADDGDTIIVNEDDVQTLRDRLTRILEEHIDADARNPKTRTPTDRGTFSSGYFPSEPPGEG
jgi:hypothetical protein